MGNCTQYIIYLNALIDALASIKKTWHHWGSYTPPPLKLGIYPLNTKAPGPPLIYLVGLLAVSDPHINICVESPNTCVALKQFNLLPPNTSV